MYIGIDSNIDDIYNDNELTNYGQYYFHIVNILVEECGRVSVNGSPKEKTMDCLLDHCEILRLQGPHFDRTLESFEEGTEGAILIN